MRLLGTQDLLSIQLGTQDLLSIQLLTGPRCSRCHNFYCTVCVCVKVKVKESRNRPGVAQRVPGGLGSQISWHSACEGGEVSLTQECSWYSFSLGAESTPGPWNGWKEICHWKIQWHHRESIPGPFIVCVWRIDSNLLYKSTNWVYIHSPPVFAV
jgi:hypothetical protein